MPVLVLESGGETASAVCGARILVLLPEWDKGQCMEVDWEWVISCYAA